MLFLNTDTLSRAYVIKEFNRAIELNCKMVFLRETDLRHGAPVDDDGHFSLEQVVKSAPHTEGVWNRFSLDRVWRGRPAQGRVRNHRAAGAHTFLGGFETGAFGGKNT